MKPLWQFRPSYHLQDYLRLASSHHCGQFLGQGPWALRPVMCHPLVPCLRPGGSECVSLSTAQKRSVLVATVDYGHSLTPFSLCLSLPLVPSHGLWMTLCPLLPLLASQVTQEPKGEKSRHSHGLSCDTVKEILKFITWQYIKSSKGGPSLFQFS